MKKKFSIYAITIFIYNFLIVSNSGQKLAGNYIDCGGVSTPRGIIDLTHTFILLLQIVIPVIIIILGSIDMARATIFKNSSDLVKKQKMFIKRIFLGISIFLIVSIVQLTLIIFAGDTNYSACIKCFSKGSANCNDAVSPNNPDFPEDKSFYDDDFKKIPLKPNAYKKDNSNSPDGRNNDNTSSGNNNNADISTMGTGENPNSTAPVVGTIITEPSGKVVAAKFTAYYPADDPMEGGFVDCKGYKLEPSKQTCAAPASIAYGSIIWIKTIDEPAYVGRPYVVTDRGGAIDIHNQVYHFDLLFPDAQSANEFGVRFGSVVIVGR